MKNEITREAKSRYAAPRLTAYGSVRNLTGGSGGPSTDANLSSLTPPV